MPRVSQEHLDARRQQIIDAARIRFADRGFAGTSLTDIMRESGLSNGAIYRYFASKDEIIAAVCEQAHQALPHTLDPEGVTAFLQKVRTMAHDQGHARLTAQIIAEATVTPELAEIVDRQLQELREAVAHLLPHTDERHRTSSAEAFVAICSGYSQQLAIRGDLDPAPFANAIIASLGR